MQTIQNFTLIFRFKKESIVLTCVLFDNHYLLVLKQMKKITKQN